MYNGYKKEKKKGKWEKNLERWYSEKKIHLANTHVQRCSKLSKILYFLNLIRLLISRERN